MMTPSKHQNILAIFRTSTGGKTTTRIPRVESDPNRLCGYHPPRVNKVRRWGSE